MENSYQTSDKKTVKIILRNNIDVRKNKTSNKTSDKTSSEVLFDVLSDAYDYVKENKTLFKSVITKISVEMIGENEESIIVIEKKLLK